jgi:hypothetical protein
MNKVLPVYDAEHRWLHIYAGDAWAALDHARMMLRNGSVPIEGVNAVIFYTPRVDLIVTGRHLHRLIAGRASFPTAALIRLDR